jgi:hypothetical protein
MEDRSSRRMRTLVISIRIIKLRINRRPINVGINDPPPLKWSDLRYVFDIKEDCNGKEAIQA